TLTLEPGLYTVEGWVRTQDVATTDSRSGVRLCLDARPSGDWWRCTEVARGTTDWTRLRVAGIPVPERGRYKVWLGAYGAPDGTAWFERVSLTAAGKPPLDVYLLYPNFRGMLFDDRSQTVRAALGVAAGTGRVKLSLVEETSGQARISRAFEVAPSLTAELDAGALPPGRYLLRAELLGPGDAVRARYPDHRVVKLPARARERLNAWYDERNVLHLGGRPAFVLGLYTTSGYSTSRSTYARGADGWGTERMAEAPINMLINYHLGRAPMPALGVYLDELHARGMRYLQTVNFYHRGDAQYREIDYPAARGGEEELNHWVAGTLGAHPGLAGFYVMDEQPAEMVPTVFRQYRALAAAAPGSVTYGVLGDGRESQAPAWRDALDVMGLDPYPIVKPTGQNDLAMVGEWTRLGQDAVKRSRPVWMVLQYFPLTAAGGWPTEAELRSMSWMAIIEGARGLLYWSFGEKGLAWIKDPRQREHKWAELVRITKEIKALEPVLLAPDAAVVSRESSGGRVRTLGKTTPDGARYLFAYNTRTTPVRVTWTLAAPATETFDLATGRPGPPPEGGAITAELGPHEVRRLRIR
ncbi:MAG TPA: hypothetical protein VFV05_25840, partial [Methylomirabilota bacterium]|nr:hypothetical protein [Methylomirabilota bacterium]